MATAAHPDACPLQKQVVMFGLEGFFFSLFICSVVCRKKIMDIVFINNNSYVLFQTDNRTLVSHLFQRAVVQNNELTRCQSENLLLFFMDNCTEVFKVSNSFSLGSNFTLLIVLCLWLKEIFPWTQTPPSLLDAVRRTLRTLKQGKDPDSISSKSCDVFLFLHIVASPLTYFSSKHDFCKKG